MARRARLLLAMAHPETIVQELADRLEVARNTIWYVCRRYEEIGVEAVFDAPRSGRPWEISPLERVEIEQLACCDPAGVGLQMTHWSTRSLAQVAVQRGIVPRIAHSTVSLILRNADVQPHRSQYWNPLLNEAFRTRAARVLWCYERALDLAQRDELVICLDEKPNLQALQRRCPTRLMRPGLIERREFEYIRHGTVNFLVTLVVATGQMRGWCLARNDGSHLRQILPQVIDHYRQARRIHLIWDGGPSHRAKDTRDFLRRSYPWVRVLFTPAHASWLNQAELLLRAFAQRYLKRGDWMSRQHLIDHLEASWQEYNRLFAHPFTWSWTRHQMHQWIDRHLH